MHHTIGVGPIPNYEEFPLFKPQQVVASWNWSLFRKAIVGMLDDDEYEKRKNMYITEYVFQVAQVYYQSAADKLKKSLRTEKILSTKCLHAMVNFGNIILEDICVDSGDRDDGFDRMVCLYGASKTCPLIFNGRLSNDSDIPPAGISNKGHNYTFNAAGTLLPLPTQSDKQVIDASEEAEEVPVPVLPHLTGACPTAALPAWRNMPCNTVFLMQIVGVKAEIQPADLDLLCQYGEAILRVSPQRSEVFGVATNLHSCKFVAVRHVIYSSGRRRYRAYCSELITKNVADELAQFVATTPESHGHRFTFPAKHLVPQEYLGTGSTGAVFSGKWCGNSTDQLLALKTSIYPGALKLERVLLGYLERQGVQGVPQIHSAAQKDLSQSSLCGAYCNVYKSRSYHVKEFTLEQAKAAWAVLESLHAVHIVHRDVRMPNIMMAADLPARIVWVDFSGARVIAGREEHVTAEALSGTSHAELQLLYEKRPVNTASDAVLCGAATLPADEGCAMIYCVLQHLLKENFCLTDMHPANEASFISFRAEWLDYYPLCPGSANPIKRIQDALAKLDAGREALSSEEICTEVHAGLSAAFDLAEVIQKADDDPTPTSPLAPGNIRKRQLQPEQEPTS
eukprot:gene12021-13936_t